MPIDFPDSPTLGQIYTAPTGRAWEWDGIRWISATETNVESLVADGLAAIVDSAPTALDTLNELAAALSDDADFATTVTNQLGSLESQIGTKTSTGKAIAMAIVFG
jgi:hypothetical protein